KYFCSAIIRLFDKIKKCKESYQFIPEEMNIGGRFGIRYRKEDDPLPNDYHVKEIVRTVKEQVNEIDIPMPEIWIEPGRSIVGDAGVSLYTIGSMKDIPNIRKYIAVDGGMSDN